MTIVPTERVRESEAFLYRTTMLRKFVCYAESHLQGLHREHLGIASARMLTLTTSAARAETMRRAVHKFVVRPLKVPPGVFLFGVQTGSADPLDAHYQNGAGVHTSLFPG
jgi:hypothetical protein